MGWARQAISTSIGKKILMATSGAMLGLFLLAHLAGNATIFFGRETFNSYARHLHSLGVLLHVIELGLLLLFLVHILTAFILFLENAKARPVEYAVKRTENASPGARTMFYTGVIILLFLCVHLENFHFTDRTIVISDLLKKILSNPAFALYYIFSLGALGLHISHGFWSMFQTLGVNHPKYNTLLRTGALTVAVMIGAVFILIPCLAILYDRFLL